MATTMGLSFTGSSEILWYNEEIQPEQEEGGKVFGENPSKMNLHSTLLINDELFLWLMLVETRMVRSFLL